MSYNANVILDSVSPAGVRLTTMELSFPKYLFGEFNTHRALSKNASSSRAIPVRKMIASAFRDPARPVEWGRNQSGMQANEQISPARQFVVSLLWDFKRFLSIAFVWLFCKLGVHKQLANRGLEEFVFGTMIVTGTSDGWGNFFFLRCAFDAQPEIRHVAQLALSAYIASTPRHINIGEWHLPLIRPEEQSIAIDTLLKLSAARCARGSYQTHHGIRDINEDLKLFERLLGGSSGAGHWSPTEHQATPLTDANGRSGNFRGWEQHRQRYANQNHTWESFTQSGLYHQLLAKFKNDDNTERAA
jgi:hypothetical protein